jgi:modulator of drug activity B
VPFQPKDFRYRKKGETLSKTLIVNGHQPHPFSKGDLNAALIKRASDYLASLGQEVRITTVAEGYDVE